MPIGHERELLWLRRIRDLTHRLTCDEEPATLLPRILDAAIELTEAERGFLVTVIGARPQGGYRIQVEAARGFDRSTLQRSESSVSRTMVRRVLEGGKGIVATSDEGSSLLGASSVVARRVVSMACVPMRLRGELRGVLYLDHCADDRAFTKADVELLEGFADPAALALETATLLASQPEASSTPWVLRIARKDLELQEGVPGFGGLTGSSPEMIALYEDIERSARTWDPVLILGESGAGKSLAAQVLHEISPRASEPHLVASCASVQQDILFGQAAGSPGLFIGAGAGTLVLDEVSDLSLELQGKLLHVLQRQELCPSGGVVAQPVRCRVVAITHQDLAERVAQGAFREDLYYRLDVLRVEVPPLRQRPSDLGGLVQRFAGVRGRQVELTPPAAEALRAYSWPGNVRQLENEVARWVSAGHRRVSIDQISKEIREGRGVRTAGLGTSGKTLGEVEREMIAAALRDCGGKKARAARQLGIPRSSLYNMIERHGLG